MYPIDQDPIALWASAQVTALKVKKWPAYGSVAWRDLKPEDPRRVAAIIESAELWRRHTNRDQWLDSLDDADWYAEVFGDARRVASHIITATRRIRRFKEAKDERAKPRPAHALKATPGWPPVAIPGRPGWRRHLLDGQQVDRPDMQQENAA